MSAFVETICVDIGNSGLRCIRLADGAQSQRTTVDATKPWAGTVLRIDWPPVHNAAGSAQDIVSANMVSPAGNLITAHPLTDQPITDNQQSTTDNGKLAESTIEAALMSWLSAASPSYAAAERGRRWIVSSVQRATESHFQTCVARVGGGEYRLLSRTDLDLELDVEAPDRVGIDRLLAAVAALAHCAARPMIVVQAGSAITVDFVAAPRRYCGGAIMPGVPMMLRLLSRAADLLPEVAAEEMLELPSLPGRNTSAAMSAGVSSAVVGGVQHLVARYRSQHGAATPIVLSGGDGPRLAPHLKSPLLTVDHLVLRGLALFAQAADQP